MTAAIERLNIETGRHLEGGNGLIARAEIELLGMPESTI
jgi:hypothetical protein